MFRLGERLGGLTTDQDVILTSPLWFAEWIYLRFGQRHFYMCSLAFSKRLLCLTGRAPFFAPNVATNPSFIEQIESRLRGKLALRPLSLVQRRRQDHGPLAGGQRLRHALRPGCESHDLRVRDQGRLQPGHRQSAALVRRHVAGTSSRAVRMGPARWKFFPWLCTIDQQISMWTSMIGITASILAWLQGRYDFVACYVIWVLVTRAARVSPACWHFRRISFWFIPLQLFSEWAGSIVKIWVYFHPVKQMWLNRGNRTQDASRSVSFAGLRRRLATYFYAVSILCFVLFVGTYTGLTSVVRELPLLLHPKHAAVSLATPAGRGAGTGNPRVLGIYRSLGQFYGFPRGSSAKGSETMNVSIFGLGYVGCVSVACLSDRRHRVIGVDVDKTKVDAIANGFPTVIEPQGGPVVGRRSSGRADLWDDQPRRRHPRDRTSRSSAWARPRTAPGRSISRRSRPWPSRSATPSAARRGGTWWSCGAPFRPAPSRR